MSFFIDNWVLIAVAFASGAMLVWPAVKAGGRAGTLNANDVVMLINREKAVVVDVSDTKEFVRLTPGCGRALADGDRDHKVRM